MLSLFLKFSAISGGVLTPGPDLCEMLAGPDVRGLLSGFGGDRVEVNSPTVPQTPATSTPQP